MIASNILRPLSIPHHLLLFNVSFSSDLVRTLRISPYASPNTLNLYSRAPLLRAATGLLNRYELGARY